MHHPNRQQEAISVLREIGRIEQIAERFLPPIASDAAIRRALENDAPGSVPSTWAGLAARLRGRREVRPYGVVWKLRHSPFFSTAPVAFLSVVLADGTALVSFEAGPRPDLAPLVARFALDGVTAAHNWRFPEDLDVPACRAAAWELALADPHRFVLADNHSLTPWLARPDGSGMLELAGRWVNLDRMDQMCLSWTPLRLAVSSREFGTV